MIVIDFKSISLISSHFSDLELLINYFNYDSPYLRVIISKNLFRNVIKLLDGKFTLDFRFFENHLRDIENIDKWINNRSNKIESAYS
jgi:hypothetical protein